MHTHCITQWIKAPAAAAAAGATARRKAGIISICCCSAGCSGCFSESNSKTFFNMEHQSRDSRYNLQSRVAIIVTRWLLHACMLLPMLLPMLPLHFVTILVDTPPRLLLIPSPMAA